MFIIKIKGKSKIPDYVQIRDKNYTLIAYFRADRPEKHLEKAGLADYQEYIMELVSKLPFGILTNLILNDK